jgi:large subunit ribosomal protein L13
MTTFMANEANVTRAWHVIDAEGQTLGRLATAVAMLLRGKHKPTFTPHVDTGDFVVIINADKIVVTGKKSTDKLYRHHTGWPGGFRQTNFAKLHAEKPIRVVELGATQFKKLKVYAGAEHPHAAQSPVPYSITK